MRAGPKLQIFVNDLGATGVVRNAVAIANAAVADGFAVRVLASIAEGPLRDELDRRIEVIGLLGAGEAGMFRKKQLRRSLPDYRRLTKEWRADILFSAGNHGHLLSTLAWLGEPGTKILRVSNELTREGGGLWRRSKFRAMFAAADRIVLVSEALSGDPLLGPALSEGRAIVIPNGVDVAAIRRLAKAPCPHPWLGSPDVPVVLAVGRHAPQKNFAFLLEAFALARRERPMRLLLLGHGTDEAVARLRQAACRLGIDEDVDFAPPTANPFSYMRAASLFVLTSLWEGFPNVLLEAMACGTPVVSSTMAGDAPRVLDEGRYGLLADPRDRQQWADAILRQLGDSPVRPGKRAEDFSRKRSLALYLDLFRRSACVGQVGGAEA